MKVCSHLSKRLTVQITPNKTQNSPPPLLFPTAGLSSLCKCNKPDTVHDEEEPFSPAFPEWLLQFCPLEGRKKPICKLDPNIGFKRSQKGEKRTVFSATFGILLTDNVHIKCKARANLNKALGYIMDDAMDDVVSCSY